MTEHDLARQLVERGIVPDADPFIPKSGNSKHGMTYEDDRRMLWKCRKPGYVAEWLPDLSDPATVGVLLGMLMERVEVAVVKSCNGYHEVVFARVDGGEEVWFCGDVRGEAIARALIEVSQ